MRILYVTLGFFAMQWTGALAMDQMQNTVVKLFKRGIVKVEVTSRSPQLDASGTDTCNVQGMGFLISKTDIITANHVINVPESCEPIISVSSSAVPYEGVADEVASYGDLALLRIRDAAVPNPMCSLAISPHNVSEDDAIRFGLPAGLLDPEPLQTRVGTNLDFPPNIRFSPAPVHAGDSGGPVIRQFHVIGVTKEKLTHLDGYGVMMPAESINRLLLNAEFRPDDSKCNPLTFAWTLNGLNIRSDALQAREIHGYLSSAAVVYPQVLGYYRIDPNSGLLDLESAQRTIMQRGMAYALEQSQNAVSGLPTIPRPSEGLFPNSEQQVNSQNAFNASPSVSDRAILYTEDGKSLSIAYWRPDQLPVDLNLLEESMTKLIWNDLFNDSITIESHE